MTRQNAGYLFHSYVTASAFVPLLYFCNSYWGATHAATVRGEPGGCGTVAAPEPCPAMAVCLIVTKTAVRDTLSHLSEGGYHFTVAAPEPRSAVAVASRGNKDSCQRTLSHLSEGGCHFTVVAPEPRSAVAVASRGNKDSCSSLSHLSEGGCHFTVVAPEPRSAVAVASRGNKDSCQRHVAHADTLHTTQLIMTDSRLQLVTSKRRRIRALPWLLRRVVTKTAVRDTLSHLSEGGCHFTVVAPEPRSAVAVASRGNKDSCQRHVAHADTLHTTQLIMTDSRLQLVTSKRRRMSLHNSCQRHVTHADTIHTTQLIMTDSRLQLVTSRRRRTSLHCDPFLIQSGDSLARNRDPKTYTSFAIYFVDPMSSNLPKYLDDSLDRDSQRAIFHGGMELRDTENSQRSGILTEFGVDSKGMEVQVQKFLIDEGYQRTCFHKRRNIPRAWKNLIKQKLLYISNYRSNNSPTSRPLMVRYL
ncbi:hypothetical protein J6590_036202 [Homalodisca vitripennis]|nr:hypothetical protein J6590_036202 [Homalodisca vitripennis]